MSILTDAMEIGNSVTAAFTQVANAPANNVNFEPVDPSIAKVPFKAVLAGSSLQGVESIQVDLEHNNMTYAHSISPTLNPQQWGWTVQADTRQQLDNNNFSLSPSYG